jgi:hypothetical protein
MRKVQLPSKGAAALACGSAGMAASRLGTSEPLDAAALPLVISRLPST